jgi:two-component system, chemotaxis family, sensor histidine kinase and response regulator PixL
MYIDPELRDRVYQLFSLEVPKMLQTIETELVTLSIDRSAEKVNNLMRSAHSIKGGAASLGLESIADLAHQIEDIFRVLNHPDLPFDRTLEQLLFQIFDYLDRLVIAEINQEQLPTEFHTKTQIILAKLDEEIGHFVIAGQQAPDGFLSNGVDLTQSIFEVDVAQSLARLERVLLDPDCDPIVVGEFRAQSEVFTGISSLTNTPGFGTIAHATISALNIHPHRAREICCFALVDFYAALEAVLTGKSPSDRLRQRAECGTISPGFAFLLAESPLPTPLSVVAIEPDLQPIRQSVDLVNSVGLAAESGFDLEAIFEQDFALDLVFTPEPEAAESFDFSDGFSIADPTEIDPSMAMIEDWVEEIGEIQIENILGLEIHPTLVPSSLPVGMIPFIPDLQEYDFLIEEILSAPAIATVDSLSFDLVDIFDLASADNDQSLAIETFQSEADQPDSLSFDLVDIFDLPSSMQPSMPDVVKSQDVGQPQQMIEAEEIVAPQQPHHLAIAIADLINSFDQLATIDPATFAAPVRAIKPIRVRRSRKVAPTPIPQLSVRVSLDRLERMNNLMGELAIERHGLSISNHQFDQTLGGMRSNCANFQTIGDRLRQIADTLTISSQHSRLPTHTDLRPDQQLDQQFDALELDRYSEVHNIAQATVEQLAQIEEQIEDLALFVTQSQQQIDRQQQILSHLRDDLMWARMLPLGEILNRFPRTLHDLSIKFNKPVDLKITGAGVLVDRSAIDKLLDPLLHLLRNAFDHGIDSAAVRQAAGKPARGLIEITAYHQGSQTVIEITDDGRGIDHKQIKAKAIALGLLKPSDAATIDPTQLLDFLFAPGFSTASQVTKLSGRGMGLDIVKAQIQSIKGTISIDSQVGRGSVFTLRIPLTLTIAQLIVCQVANATYAFPADSIQRIVVPTTEQLSQQDDQLVFAWNNLTVPVYKLADLLAYGTPIPERTISQTLNSSASNPIDWLPPLLLIRRGNQIVALQIDQLIAEQELTIVPFGKAITAPSYSYGCTILGDGVVLPVLDPHTLIQVLVEQPRCSSIVMPIESMQLRHDSILVVDDSITTRQSLCLTLEKFGYHALQAKDGQEALQILRQKSSEIQLVICDVEMPNMNGFEFLNVYRQDQEISHIPVVMLTSRSNAKHRQFAAHLGAIDYFIKPYVEQELIAAIAKIIEN